MLSEIDGCLHAQKSFALESTLSGMAQVDILKRARSLSYRVEIFYLWIPSPAVASQRIAQRAVKGGHRISAEDVERRYHRSLLNFVRVYAPLADLWQVWNNTARPPKLSHRFRRRQKNVALLPPKR